MKSDYQFLVSVTIDGKMVVKATDEDMLQKMYPTIL